MLQWKIYINSDIAAAYRILFITGRIWHIVYLHTTWKQKVWLISRLCRSNIDWLNSVNTIRFDENWKYSRENWFSQGVVNFIKCTVKCNWNLLLSQPNELVEGFFYKYALELIEKLLQLSIVSEIQYSKRTEIS